MASAFSWKTSATARLVRATHGPAWSVEGEHDGCCKTFGVRHVRRIRRTETGFFIDDQLLRRTRPPDTPLGNTRPLAVTLRFLCDPRVAIALDGNDVMIGGRHDSLCRIAPPPGFVAEIAETMHSERFGHLAPTRQIIFAGALSNEMATTHIAIAGPARPPVYPGEPAVAASDPQSDMREKAWH